MVFNALLELTATPGFAPSVVGLVLWLLVFALVRYSLMWLALLAFPGVVAHEFAHFLAGLMTRAGPTEVTLWPERTPHGWRLGSVSFERVGIFNGVFVAFAPLALAPLSMLLLEHAASPFWVEGRYVAWFFTSFLTASMLQASLPSWQDIKVGAPSMVFYGLVLAAGSYAVYSG